VNKYNKKVCLSVEGETSMRVCEHVKIRQKIMRFIANNGICCLRTLAQAYCRRKKIDLHFDSNQNAEDRASQ